MNILMNKMLAVKQHCPTSNVWNLYKLGCKIPSNSPEITDYPVILPFFGAKAVPLYVKLLCFLKKDFWVIGQ